MRGVALEPLARSVGIDIGDLGRHDVRISLAAFMRLLHLLEIVSGDDCIGLRYALHFQRGDSGALGFALLHAPTLREALRIYRTYQPIVAEHSFFDVTEEGADVMIRWRYSRLIEYPEQFIDLHAGVLLKVLRGFLGQGWMPRKVELQRKKPRSTMLHRSHFGPGVSFDAEASSCISLPAAALDTSPGTGDPRLFDMMEAICRANLAALDRGRDPRLQVTEHLLALLPQGEAKLGRVAKAMAIGERSLQRRLVDLGTSFERIVEETRRELSDRLLATDMPLSEISYLCGYSSASAYSRAARAWYGMAPQAKRQRLRGSST